MKVARSKDVVFIGWRLDRNAGMGLTLIVVTGGETTVPTIDLPRSKWVQIEISSRHGGLGSEQQRHIHDKAEKLTKYFGRLMAIEVAVDHGKHGWEVEILVSAEHKHDFVAKELGTTAEAAMDVCVHKIEQQLRRYKEKVQNHKGDVTHAGPSPRSHESHGPASTETDLDEG
jgi:putative sigma-54 modulation protein